MAAPESGFDAWLKEKLRALNTDEGVFSSYIRGILEGSETQDEKAEALEEILAEATGAEIATLCQEILQKWTLMDPNGGRKGEMVAVSVDAKLAEIIKTQAQSIAAPKKYTEEQKQLRDAILSQYGQISDQEDDGDSYQVVEEESGKDGGEGLTKNTNAESVNKAEREKRDKAKLESQKKKEKDKEDREKQRQVELERKEKEKKRTQKGEKRR